MAHETHEIEVETIIPETASTRTHTVFLPLSESMAKDLELEQRIHVSFTGTIKEISSGFSDDKEASISVDIKAVTIDTENEFEVLSKDDD